MQTQAAHRRPTAMETRAAAAKRARRRGRTAPMQTQAVAVRRAEAAGEAAGEAAVEAAAQAAARRPPLGSAARFVAAKSIGSHCRVAACNPAM